MIIGVVKIESHADYSKLWDVIPEDFLSTDLVDSMGKSFSPLIRTILIEYPYVDKDYRSTYYGFYSKRHRKYDKFCFRLHFFGQHLAGLEDLNPLNPNYFGSIVLRPTEVTPQGRTLLSPKAIAGFEGFVAEASFENNLMGIPLNIKSFPHISQDTDVTICAHSVCWMIARYYSEKYGLYPERLSFDIAQAVTDLSEGRIIPSRGLTLGQVSEVMASIGFYPEIFVKELYADKEVFYDLLYCYVESGVPVVCAGNEHAVAVLGHGPLRSATEVCRDIEKPVISARHCIDRFVINDDNRMPFFLLPNDAGEGVERGINRLEDIDSFVVPQYEKMYLNAENVLKLCHKLGWGGLLDLPEKKYVLRVFMTSSRSYKREIRQSQGVSEAVKKAQVELPMPKFIWVVEMASPEVYDQSKAEFRWIIDATANHYENMPFLVIHDKRKMLLYDRAVTGEMYRLTFSPELAPFSLYQNNLRRYP
ncbi:MAG: hypothetical protein U5R49_06445 [Deltaproteobacteria bacterium]|nr:hypothetical protein [Deltaproteobacteria bacterium]